MLCASSHQVLVRGSHEVLSHLWWLSETRQHHCPALKHFFFLKSRVLAQWAIQWPKPGWSQGVSDKGTWKWSQCLFLSLKHATGLCQGSLVLTPNAQIMWKWEAIWEFFTEWELLGRASLSPPFPFCSKKAASWHAQSMNSVGTWASQKPDGLQTSPLPADSAGEVALGPGAS